MIFLEQIRSFIEYCSLNKKIDLTIKSFFNDVEEIFFTDEALGQVNIGNCYLIIVLHSLRSKPKLKIMLEKSIEKLEDGSYSVKIPIDGSGKIINIMEKDLGLKYEKEGNFYNKINFSSLGPKGTRILEAAYIKDKFNGIRVHSTNGFEVNAFSFLIGENNVYGKQNFSIKENKKNNYDEGFEKLSIILNGFNFIDNQIFLGKDNHAYSVEKIDTEKKEVLVTEPFDTDKKIIYSYIDFYNFFDLMHILKINYENLLKN